MVERAPIHTVELDSYVPAYLQLARSLEERILSGELKAGTRIPTESELCCDWGLSRMTVRRAIGVLSERCLVRSERGRGTFVINPRTEGGVFLIPDFYEEMRSTDSGYNVTLLGVKVVSAGKKAAVMLDLRKGQSVLYIERILEERCEPLVFDRKYLLFDGRQPLLEAELGHGDPASLFERSPDMSPVRADLHLTATILNEREARLLNSDRGAPAFCMEQEIYAANDRRVAWGWHIYRGDKFSFSSLGRGL
jgi:GntR family transcriptional regulator